MLNSDLEKVKKGLKIKSALEKPFIDNSEWKIYNLKTGKVIITGVGRKKVKEGESSVLEIIARYKRALKQSEKEKSNYMTEDEANAWEVVDKSRKYISQGYNAKVYSIGNQIAAKESYNVHLSLEETIKRMDILKWVMDNSDLPKWIGMPEHYGVAEFFDEKNKKKRSIMFMEQIDCGVNVDDVYNMKRWKKREDKQYILRRIQNNLGDVTDGEIEEIRDSVAEMISMISEAISQVGMKTGGTVFSDQKLLPDLRSNPRNILIERLHEPINGKKFKLWVIDQ